MGTLFFFWKIDEDRVNNMIWYRNLVFFFLILKLQVLWILFSLNFRSKILAGLVTSRMPGFGKGVPPSTRWGSQEMGYLDVNHDEESDQDQERP